MVSKCPSSGAERGDAGPAVGLTGVRPQEGLLRGLQQGNGPFSEQTFPKLLLTGGGVAKRAGAGPALGSSSSLGARHRVEARSCN